MKNSRRKDLHMTIKAVILDFGGTLSDGALDWDTYHEKLRSILASRGYLVEMSVLKKALRGALGDLNRIRAKGKEMTFEEVYDIFLGRLEIPGDREILDELHDNFRDHYRTEFFPCVEDVLKSLAERYKVALLSNTMSDQPRMRARPAHLHETRSHQHKEQQAGQHPPGRRGDPRDARQPGRHSAHQPRHYLLYFMAVESVSLLGQWYR